MPASIHPILRHARPAAPVCHERGGDVTVSGFLADAAALAEQLPRADHVVNLCADRYRFAVGLVAALLRGQVTLLPMSAVSAPIVGLTREFPALYALHDEMPAPAGMPVYRFPMDLAGPTSETMPAVPALRSDQPAVVLFTSGSTGKPVPYPRSWGALIASTTAAACKLGIANLTGASVLGTVPHQHSYGLESIIMLALQQGFAFHGARPLLPADIVEELAALPAPRILVTTPIHLRSLVGHEVMLPQLHRIICATAPLTPGLAREAERRFRAPLYEIYGCTEIGQIAVRRTVETLEWSCLDGIELQALDGDVRASGPAAASAAPLNDIVELLSPGRFLLHGRKSDLVNIAGKRSSLSYLNFQLNAIEGVHDGVFVMPAEGKGVTRLTAYVVAPALSAEDILGALRGVLDPAFLPRPLHVVDALPRNALGKLPLHALAQMNNVVAER